MDENFSLCLFLDLVSPCLFVLIWAYILSMSVKMCKLTDFVETFYRSAESKND